MPAPPSYQKVNPADQPILYLALSSPTLPLSDVDEYAETLMAQRISMISGVAQVQVFGAQKYAVRVQLDPERAGLRAASASTKCERAVAERQRQPAHRHAVRAAPGVHRPGQRPAHERGRPTGR